MILLVTPSSCAAECADALHDANHHPVQTCETLEQASVLLRDHEFLAVVLDQLAMEVDPDAGEILHIHLGSAIPVYVNFAINSKRRIVQEVAAALRRRSADERVARQFAQQTLRGELNETVTAMLLSCDLLVASNALPELAKQKIRGVQELASHLQVQLGAVS